MGCLCDYLLPRPCPERAMGLFFFSALFLVVSSIFLGEGLDYYTGCIGVGLVSVGSMVSVSMGYVSGT